jgi:hypothetical protein
MKKHSEMRGTSQISINKKREIDNMMPQQRNTRKWTDKLKVRCKEATQEQQKNGEVESNSSLV